MWITPGKESDTVICTWKQRKQFEYVAWAQDFLTSLHRAFKVQQGLVHSPLPHVFGIWDM